MSSGFRASSPLESVLIVRLGAMGDVIHTLAAVTGLRAACPDLRIGWVVEERWSELLVAKGASRSGSRSPHRPVADFVHIIDTKRWRRSPLSAETYREIVSMRRELRAQKYQVASDFQGALKSALVARSSGASTVAGFEWPREGPARFLYSARFAAEGVHVVDQYHSLAEALAGNALPNCVPVFPRDERAEAEIEGKLREVSPEFVLINPGAGWGAKQWPAERYGKVTSAISAMGLTPIINFGPGEQELAAEVQQASGGKAYPISCSISELIALTRRARLFVGGDTGPMHLAAALGIPVVAIFGPTDPARNGPYGTKSVVLRNPASITSLSHTRTPDRGLLNISMEEVISATHQLLERPDA